MTVVTTIYSGQRSKCTEPSSPVCILLYREKKKPKAYNKKLCIGFVKLVFLYKEPEVPLARVVEDGDVRGWRFEQNL